MKRRDNKWDITLNQLVNGMYGVENYIVHDSAYEDDPDGVEFTFSSHYVPSTFLLPKYALAKVQHCEYVSCDTLRVYIKLDEEKPAKTENNSSSALQMKKRSI